MALAARLQPEAARSGAVALRKWVRQAWAESRLELPEQQASPPRERPLRAASRALAPAVQPWPPEARAEAASVSRRVAQPQASPRPGAQLAEPGPLRLPSSA